ncbi:MAG: PAS domain S-box protein, partial [Acidobacteriaceae bacterium]|nr:PAS domain S-box protein [Acidobacteriaceae bacterium]
LDHSGQPTRKAGVNLDITDRKQTEAALRESQQRYKEVFDITSDSIFLIDITSEGRFKFAGINPACEKTMGFSDAEVSNRFVEDILDSKVAEEVSANYRRCVEAGTLIDYEEELYLRGGHGYFHTTLIPARNSEGRIHRIIGVAHDITERKRAEAAVRESEERFRKVFEEGPVGIGLVGTDYRFRKVNAALCRMVGYSEAELTQMTFLDITHPDDLPANMEQAERIFRQKVPSERIIKRYVKKNGEIIWVKLTASLILGANGMPDYGVALIEDITEIKRTQEEALARQKLESVGVLASGIAHDFNNLLGGILAEAELAQTDLAANSSVREPLERITAVATRAAQIVRELMIYSGQDQVKLEPVDISLLVEEMLELLKVSISKRSVLKMDLQENLPAVLGNSTQLRQVVMNLIINASEAIGDTDGVITVTTARLNEDSGPLGAANLPQGEYLQLEVSDTGCGITEESKAKIFDPFFSTKFAGRGLGLAVVQGIVSAHGGAINVVSVPAQGTSFQIFLPCSAEPAKRDTSTTVPVLDGRHASSSGTVLLVDDEETLRRAVSGMLRKKGFSVLEAGDGRSAVDLFRDQKDHINVVLLDMTIPGTSSHEIITEAQRIRPEIKILLTSAYDRDVVMPSLEVPQVRGFIRKPFHLAEVVQLVRDTLCS